MNDTLELCVLDTGGSANAVIFARGGDDVAISTVPFATLAPLTQFRQRLEGMTTGAFVRITSAELERFGRDLFAFAIRGDVLRLYNRLPASHVRIHLVSNQPDLQALPWEFFTEPGNPAAPRLERSIVRIVPTIGTPAPVARPLARPTRVLFLASDPSDLPQVSWPAVKASIEQAFAAQIPKDFAVTAIESTTKTSLLSALQAESFDILHFSGHGTVLEGEGHLALTNRSGKSVFVSATEFMTYVRGRGLQLIILSACNSAAGSFARDFSVIAKSLVESGIPAVVANQLPVLNETVAAFVAALYQQLLRSGDIDRAVAEGRLRLFAELSRGGKGLDRTGRAALEWGIPTLYRHSGGAHLFTP